jgi:hypothetical protein
MDDKSDIHKAMFTRYAERDKKRLGTTEAYHKALFKAIMPEPSKIQQKRILTLKFRRLHFLCFEVFFLSKI